MLILMYILWFKINKTTSIGSIICIIANNIYIYHNKCKYLNLISNMSEKIILFF